MDSKKNPLRRQPQQKRSQERVERILDAAALVFEEVGFEAATTHAIAAKADTAVGSLYQFFPDKLAIFNALELRHVDRVYVIWNKLLQPEIVQLPFAQLIHTIRVQFQKLFEQPTSKIIFVQFFIAPTILKNIDHSFTQEAINFLGQLLRARNPALSSHRSQLLAEICVHGINTLILLALRSEVGRCEEIFVEIEAILYAYLKNEIGDQIIDQSCQLWEQLRHQHQLNSRQSIILKYALNNLEVTIQNCEMMLPDVSRRTLQRDLKILQQRNLLLPQGHTDQRIYRYNQNPKTSDS